jgi:hypothetical protein
MKISSCSKLCISALLITVFAVSACKKKEEPDTEAPKVILISPADEEEFEPGGSLNLSALFTDNKELSEMQIDIHEDDDGHKHESSRNAPWSTRKSFTLAGTAQSVQHQFDIPADADTGAYHLVINVLDKAGNKGITLEREFHLHLD